MRRIMRVIISGYCSLTRFSLEIILKEIMSIQKKQISINADKYVLIDNKHIKKEERDIYILDVDNSSLFDSFKTIEKIRQSSPLSFIIVLGRKNEKMGGYSYLSVVADCILCKTASIKTIKNMLIVFLTSSEPPKKFHRTKLVKKLISY
ncbi:hypothetical protein [Yersinia massiliensis]|uniref:hypothetical protein n=1 Tax=Yersinia massiliensis TaxID=419257 RepID=UPI00117E89A5|nr:hypothetical protein [Yersinia massiliensis]